jgi:hypothetical protein
MRSKFFVLLLLFSLNLYAQKYEGLAKTPPMGWNSWNIAAPFVPLGTFLKDEILYDDPET